MARRISPRFMITRFLTLLRALGFFMWKKNRRYVVRTMFDDVWRRFIRHWEFIGRYRKIFLGTWELRIGTGRPVSNQFSWRHRITWSTWSPMQPFATLSWCRKQTLAAPKAAPKISTHRNSIQAAGFPHWFHSYTGPHHSMAFPTDLGAGAAKSQRFLLVSWWSDRAFHWVFVVFCVALNS